MGEGDTFRARLESLWQGAISEGARPDVTLKRSVAPIAETIVSKSSAGRPVRAGDRLQGTSLPDYEILRVLGEGGMGVVYQARQTSVDRTIALKMIKPGVAREQVERERFLAEAMATAELDHPNIVPIHDLGSNEQGVLFYAMKEVRGRRWSEAIADKSLDENLDILLRVADAVAFAHSKGVIHRDLKPDNVMLGDYGEVLLMDWGLAASVGEGEKAERLAEGTAIGGTPAYMAPEMAVGDVSRIGPQSDVYLLGAVLFEIATGKRPHSGDSVMECLAGAAENRIEDAEQKGELVEIALRAMATQPEDRYDDVKAFQSAVRDYQRHEESIRLAADASEELAQAEASANYDHYADALSGYRQALKLWAANGRAEVGLAAARLGYAQCAFGKRDFDLAGSLLDPVSAEHQGLATKIAAARRAREARRRRIKTLTYGTATLAAAIIVVLAASFLWVQSARRAEQVQRQKAEQALADYESEQARRQTDRHDSAPSIIRSARMFIEQGEFDTARRMAEAAIDYDPELPEAWLTRGLLLLRSEEYAAAREACAVAVRLQPLDEDARLVFAVSAMAVEGGAEAAPLPELGGVASRLGLPTLAAEFSGSAQERLLHYQAKIEKAWPGLGGGLATEDDGSFYLKALGALDVADLAPLRGIPLSRIVLQGSLHIRDLSPLVGMPLRELGLSRCSGVRDLTPLRGLPMERLNLICTAVEDLAPLQGMPLTTLVLDYTPVTDIAPLRGHRMEDISLAGTGVSDLSPLLGMPLRRLQVPQCSAVSDLSPLKGMPLQTLSIARCVRITDLSPLAGAPLSYLNAEGASSVSDLTPLAGMPLVHLNVRTTGVEDLGPLRGMRLEELKVLSTRVRDLSPLRGMPLRILDLEHTQVTDLTPLSDAALETLSFTPANITEGIDTIRKMETIRQLGAAAGDLMPPSEFWRRYDAGEFDAQDD